MSARLAFFQLSKEMWYTLLKRLVLNKNLSNDNQITTTSCFILISKNVIKRLKHSVDISILLSIFRNNLSIMISVLAT